MGRADNPNRHCQIHIVEQVARGDAEGHVVALVCGASRPAKRTARAAWSAVKNSAAWTTGTSGAARTSSPTAISTFAATSVLVLLIVICRVPWLAKAKSLGQTNV